MASRLLAVRAFIGHSVPDSETVHRDHCLALHAYRPQHIGVVLLPHSIPNIFSFLSSPRQETQARKSSLGTRSRGRGRSWVFRAINDNDGVYVTLARRQTVLELGTTKGPTRSLRLDCSLSRRSRWDARIIAGGKSLATNTLSGGITKTGRERRLSAGPNETPVDASLRPTRLSAEY